jgi:hypothetical protein
MAKKSASTNSENKKTESKIDLQKFLKEIEKRAYEIYEKRIASNSNGDEFSDWLKAESEIKAKYKLL